MALGSKNNNPNLRVFSLKLKIKDEPKPIFIVTQKNEDGKFSEVDRVSTVSGNLTGLEHRETPYMGDIIKSVSVYLRDGDELYMISLPYTILARSVFNSILSMQTFENVEISLYMSKPRGPEAKSYPAASVWQNRKKVDWAFKLEELPEAPTIVFKGKNMRDTEALDKFFSDKVAEFGKKLKNEAVVVPNRESPTAQAASTEASSTDGIDEEVPF